MEDATEDKISEEGGVVGERVLYEGRTWEYGYVLVTDRRLVLNKEAWRIGDIQDVQLVTQLTTWSRLKDPNPRNMVSLSVGFLLLVLIIAVIRSDVWDIHPVLFAVLTLGLMVVFIGNVLWLVFRGTRTVYKLQLSFRNGQRQEANLMWDKEDKYAAQEVVKAIQQALATHIDDIV